VRVPHQALRFVVGFASSTAARSLITTDHRAFVEHADDMLMPRTLHFSCQPVLSVLT
jgi:hypothetical protein